MKQTITEKFLDSIWDFAGRPADDRIKDQVKNCVIDYLACTMLGAHLAKEENRGYLESFSDARGNIPVVGAGIRTGVFQAAMLNGMNSHLIELDDGNRYAMLHLGAPVISAMLVVAGDRGLDPEHFIKGVVVGYEAVTRLAAAIQPGHKLKGYHATGTCGTIGTALGIAAAIDLPRDCWNTVISAAATDAAGLLQVIDDGSELKPYNAGRAVTAAVQAAYMGITRLAGPTDVLGGPRGFFKATADEVKENYLLEGFLPDYAIERIYKKPYAACRHCHSAIEAALNIRKDNGLSSEDITEVEVDTYGLAVKGHEHVEVKGAGSAKMSIPYAVACALRYGRVNYQQYEEDCLEDQELLALARKVSVREDEAFSKLVPGKRVALVKVRAGEDLYQDQVEYPLGEPENPMTQDMLEEKYHSLLAAAGISEDRRQKLLAAVYDIEHRFDELLESL